MAGVVALAPGARHFVARRILLALKALDLRDQATPVRLDGRQLLQFRGRVQTPGQQAVTALIEVITNECRIEHA